MTVATQIGYTTVFNGDCLDVMATLAALGFAVDSVVTDPPYHLTSTVARYAATSIDAEGTNEARARAGADAFGRSTRGFMGQKWDGGDVAFRPETWRAVYDLLKPGGHLIAFSGSRTYHRMACAIEDAGFEIRDQIMWLYGTGFPKSHDVSKDLDKRAGAEREVIATGAPVARMIPGADQHATGSWIKDNGRVYVPTVTQPATNAARTWEGWGTALKPAHEPMVLARKPLIGTVAENVLTHGTGAINIDASRVGSEGGTAKSISDAVKSSKTVTESGNGLNGGVVVALDKGRFPANVIHDGSDEVLAEFAKYGERAVSGSAKNGTRSEVTARGAILTGPRSQGALHNDTGTAARFFYSAKASAKDRAGSKHPTVKPVDLIRYLATLVTPPGGVCLDPFAGSGTLGAAWPRSILIEREETYYTDILRRLNDA